tara:strand:+ start:477 stop:1889 length:1413 start_codon:yes stop_codon:yes gene_type:complete
MDRFILNKLKDVRVSRGWTQELLSQASGLSRRTIQRLEAGAPASVETIKSLLSTLELPNVDSLVDSKSENIKIDKVGVYFSSFNPKESSRDAVFVQYLSIIAFSVWLGAWVAVKLDMQLLSFHLFSQAHVIAEHWGISLISLIAFLFSDVLFPKESYSGFVTTKNTSLFSPRPYPFLKSILTRFDIKDRNYFVGLTRGSKKLISFKDAFDIKTGVAFVGETRQSSYQAQQTIMPFACLGFGGLVLLTKTEAPKMGFFKKIPEWLKRDNLLILDSDKAAHKTPKWWFDNISLGNIIVVRCDEEESKVHNDVLNNFFEGIKIDCYEPNTKGLFPFLYINDKHINNFEHFNKEFEINNRLNGLKLIFNTDNIEKISSDPSAIMFINKFDHVHILKSHKNKEIELLLAGITNKKEFLSKYDVTSLPPYKSIYRYRIIGDKEHIFFGVELFYISSCANFPEGDKLEEFNTKIERW